ncbi:MAG: hypothetical protein DWQ37_20160 [Planctomycetota bacterium]|nr:MAG: hypothetical protein DWQ37_20160 [Planctomycetota bacterium]
MFFDSAHERKVFRAQFRYWSWQLWSKLVFGVMYFGVMSEGFRVMIPALAQKVHKLPGFAFLYDYEATYRLDLAHFMAIGLLVAVMMTWAAVLELWLGIEERHTRTRVHSGRHQALVVLMAWVLLGGEGYVFYSAIGELGWSGSGFSLIGLIATAVYLSVMVAVTYKSVCLRNEMKDLMQERDHAATT